MFYQSTAWTDSNPWYVLLGVAGSWWVLATGPHWYSCPTGSKPAGFETPCNTLHQNSCRSYKLEELDGAPINGIFAGNRLKKYHLHDHIARMENTGNQSHSTMDEELIKYNMEKHMKNTNHTKTFERKIFTKPLQNPVSLGPENQLTTYCWPLLRAMDSWGYRENKIVEWKQRNILKEISGKPKHEPQIIESD
jgi:hypothetical protein